MQEGRRPQTQKGYSQGRETILQGWEVWVTAPERIRQAPVSPEINKFPKIKDGKPTARPIQSAAFRERGSSISLGFGAPHMVSCPREL